MGSILASTIISAVASDLNDIGHNHWSEAELLGFLNESQRAICVRKPSAFSVQEVFTATENYLHQLPASANMLLDITKNAAGNKVHLVDEAALNIEDASWRNQTASANPTEYMYNPVANPREFKVNPPMLAGDLTLLLAKTPPDIATVNAAITLQDIYEPAMKAYTMFMALSSEGVGKATEKAQGYFQVFAATLGKV